MKTSTAKSTGEQLRELIIINNDRYEGYKTAAEETKDTRLKGIFEEYSHQSKKFSDELQKFLPANSDQAPAPGETKNSGKIYRAFMDMKATLRGKDNKGILSSCEYGEDTAKKTYDDVLENSVEDSEVLDIIRKQREKLQKSHDKIKMMRDSA